MKPQMLTKYCEVDIEDEIKASGEEVKYAGADFRTIHGASIAKIPLNVFGY
jgi:enolase